jgi:hypothetical protein
MLGESVEDVLSLGCSARPRRAEDVEGRRTSRRGVRTQPLALGVLLAPLCLLAPAGFVVRPSSATEDREEIAAFILAREPLRRDQRTVDVPRQPGGDDEHVQRRPKNRLELFTAV